MGDQKMTEDRGTSDTATADRAVSHALNWRPRPVLPRLSGPVRHTVVFFSGWKKENVLSAAEQLPPRSGTVTEELMIWVRRLMPAEQLRVIGFYGVLGENPAMWVANKPGNAAYHSTIASAARFILANYDPRGKLVIYGYSAGAVTATDLARGMHEHANVWVDGKGLGRKGDPAHRNLIEYPVRVDLLITIDAAAGPLSDYLNRTVPAIVALNHNIYQTSALPNEDYSRGGPNRAIDASRTEVNNDDWTGRKFRRGTVDYVATHYRIGLGTNSLALRAITDCLIPTVRLVEDPVPAAGKGRP